MDWKSFDRVRRNVGPVHLDLVESYARGKISRRNFIRRGTIIGLSMPFIGAVISACGDDDDDSATPGTGTGAAPGTSTAGQQGGIIRIAYQTPAATLDPIAMQDLGAYGLTAQSFEFLVTLGEDGELAPGLAESWEPNEDGTVWTFNLRQGVTWQDGGDFTSADVAATMDRLVVAANAGLAGVIAEGAVDTTDPNVAVFNLEGANGNFPYLVSVFNAQTLITPVELRDRHDARRHTQRHRTVEADQLRPGDRRVVRTQPRLLGRPDTTRRPGDAVLRRRRHDGDGDAGWRRRRPRAVLRARWRSLAEQPRLHGPRGGVLDAPPDLDALRHGPVRRQGGAPGARLHVRPRADGQHAVPGPRRGRQRPRLRHVHAVLRRVAAAAAGEGHRDGPPAARRRRRSRAVCRPSSTPPSCRRSPSSPS